MAQIDPKVQIVDQRHPYPEAKDPIWMDDQKHPFGSNAAKLGLPGDLKLAARKAPVPSEDPNAFMWKGTTRDYVFDCGLSVDPQKLPDK